MGIGKDGGQMSFKGCDEVLPPQMFLSMVDDGDTAVVVFVGEPVPREETFKKATRYRYYFPVVSKEGLQAWGVGSKTYRILRDDWPTYLRKPFRITRHGAAGSTDTKYELEPSKGTAGINKMAGTLAKKDIDPFIQKVQEFGEAAE